MLGRHPESFWDKRNLFSQRPTVRLGRAFIGDRTGVYACDVPKLHTDLVMDLASGRLVGLDACCRKGGPNTSDKYRVITAETVRCVWMAPGTVNWHMLSQGGTLAVEPMRR